MPNHLGEISVENLIKTNSFLKREIELYKFSVDLIVELNRCSSQEELMDILISRISKIIGTDDIYIYTYGTDNKNGLKLKNNKTYNKDTNFGYLKGKAEEFMQIYDANRDIIFLNLGENLIGIPIISQDEIIGVIEISSKEKQVEEYEIAMIKKFGGIISDIIADVKLHEKQSEISMRLIQISDPDILLKDILDISMDLMKAEHGGVFIFDPENDSMELKYGKGLYAENKGHKSKKGIGVSGKIWQEGKQYLCNNYNEWPFRNEDSKWNFKSLCGVPLKNKNEEIMGIILVGHTIEKKISDKNMSILEGFANMAAIALLKAQDFKQIQDLNIELDKHLKIQETEINKLKDLLPVCCKCRGKIRNNKGEWEKIYNYLETHEDIRLSHGFCPECEEEYKKEMEM